ncbi:MAG: flagellar hook-length control protein FliK [Rhodospirillales bacterium]|nr:flagellar hook-length control protein FliK [Rhodospirillales bacterium]
MEDLSVKAKTLNPAVPTFKDTEAGFSPADALAQAFSQFLRKAAAKPNQLLAGARGQVVPFHFAFGADRADSGLARAGFERADDPTPRADTAPAPAAPHDDRRSSGRDGHESADASAPAANEPDGTRADSSAQTTTKDDAHGRHAQPKGQAPESADGDDRGRGRGKKSADGIMAKENSDSPKELAVAVLTGNADKRANDDAQAPAEQANETADEIRRMAGIANALSQIAKQPRGAVRPGSNHGAEDNQAAASGERIEAGSESDKAAAKRMRWSGESRAHQASDLAERVGTGTRMSVEVTVNDDAKSLVSRPAATLSAAHADKDASAALARLGNGDPDGTGEQAFSAAIQSDPTEAVAGRLAAITGMGGPNAASQTSAEADKPGIQVATQGLATGGGSSARALEAPSQANAAQNAQKPAANFRAEVLEQVSVTIQKAIKDGTDRITIQLRPAELGRIDVRIEVAGDGRTLVHVAADRSDTLDLLQRDARDLARALQDAGLRADTGSLQFSLREQTAEHRERRARGSAANSAGALNGVAAEPETAPVWTPTVRPGRVDIRA